MAEALNTNRKEQIIATAARLFKKDGYAATSMRDIAAALEIEAASLYHHIKSKEEILESICFDMADKFLNGMREVNDIYFNAEEKLRTLIKNHVEILTGNLDYSAVFLHEWRSLNDEKFESFKKLRDAYEQGVRVILTDGINEDRFEEVDLKFATLSILASVNWITEWYKPEGRMTPDEIAEAISNFILGGLRRKRLTE
jgi:AcrR family transcriptional regulator